MMKHSWQSPFCQSYEFRVEAVAAGGEEGSQVPIHSLFSGDFYHYEYDVIAGVWPIP